MGKYFQFIGHILRTSFFPEILSKKIQNFSAKKFFKISPFSCFSENISHTRTTRYATGQKSKRIHYINLKWTTCKKMHDQFTPRVFTIFHIKTSKYFQSPPLMRPTEVFRLTTARAWRSPQKCYRSSGSQILGSMFEK